MFSRFHGFIICCLVLAIAFVGSVAARGPAPAITRIPISSIKSTANGETPYGDGTKGQYLAPNTTTTRKFLRETGTGSAGQAPAWDTIAAGDITSGLLALARGGTNADLSATGGASQYVKQVSSGAAFTVGTIPAADVPNAAGDVTGPYTALVVAKVNGNTFPASAALGDIFYGSAANAISKLTGNTTSTNKYLQQTGTGSVSAAPSWGTIPAADVPGLDASKIISGTLPTTRGGTGSSLTTPAQGGVVYVNSSSVMTPLAAGTSGQVLQTNGASADPSWATITAAGSGIGAWSSAVTYATSNVVIGSDNNLYIALVSSNLNHNPTTDSGTNWALYYVTANLTLNVSTAGGARFGGLVTGTNPVWTFCKFAYIPPAVTLTIQFADGTYSFSAAQTLNHPCGAQISILGNTTTPANCVLSFSGAVSGVVVSNGCTLGNFNGFKMLGTASGVNAVQASAGATILCGTKVVASTWQSGFVSAGRSYILCDSCTADTCSIAGFLVNVFGAMSAQNSSSTGNTGDGYRTQMGSFIRANGSTSTGNTGWGYIATDGNAFLYASSVTANTNTAGNYSPAINTVGNNNSYIKQ